MTPAARTSVVAVPVGMLVAAGAMTTVPRASVPTASPESVGLSSAGLQAYGQALKALVDQGRLAGVSTLVARRGKVAMFEAYGLQSLEARTPLTKDTMLSLPV